MAKGCYSEWGPVPSGVPQGTKLGPWLSILMIQDLDISTPFLWKFVDDTTASEILAKGSASTAKNIADHVMQWSEENRLQLHPDKCKELRISFSRLNCLSLRLIVLEILLCSRWHRKCKLNVSSDYCSIISS